MKLDHTSKIIAFALILIFYVMLLTFKIDLQAGEDMGRHIKNGELILQGHFEVLYQNVYSYTMSNQPFINHHWLSGVFFYLVQQFSGWEGLVLFKVIVMLCTFILLFFVSLKKANFWLVSLLSIPVILLLYERCTLRPETFTYLFMALFLYLLTDLEMHPGRKRIFWLLPIQLLWVNMHVFFIIGPFIVGCFLLEKVIHKLVSGEKIKSDPVIRKLLLILLLLPVICLLNPNLVQGAIYPFNIFTDYCMQVAENMPLSYAIIQYVPETSISSIVFYPALLIAVIGVFANIKKIPVFYSLLITATAVGTIFIIRLIASFGLIMLPAASSNLNDMFTRVGNSLDKIFTSPQRMRNRATGIFIFFLGFLIILKGSGYYFAYSTPGVGLTDRSNDAADFFIKNKLQGPLLNCYDNGSYLDYHLYPRQKTFIDNRPEAFSCDFITNVYHPVFLNDSIWKETAKKYRFNSIFLYPYDETAGLYEFQFRRYNDPEWALVFADNYAVIFMKRNEKNSIVIKNYEITPENVEQRVRHLIKSENFEENVAAADIFNLTGNTERGMQTFFDILEKWPQKGKLWVIMAKWELISDNPKSPLLAISYLKKALSIGYRTPETYTALGSAYLRISYTTQAQDALAKALKIDPEYQEAKEVLKSIHR